MADDRSAEISSVRERVDAHRRVPAPRREARRGGGARGEGRRARLLGRPGRRRRPTMAQRVRAARRDRDVRARSAPSSTTSRCCNELAVSEDDEDTAAEIERALDGAEQAHRRRSSSRAGSPASSTTATRSSRSSPAQAGSRARTGPRCCCACSRSTPSRDAGRSTCTTPREGRSSASSAPSSPCTAATRTACSRPSRACTASCASRPTDEKKRRHTTFAKVDVLPVLPDEIVVEITRRGPARRRLPLERARRPVRQHDRLGRAHHAHPDGHRRHRARTRRASSRTRTRR